MSVIPQSVAYKESGIPWVGKIPEHWGTIKVNKISNMINGYAFDSNDFNFSFNIPVIRIGDIQNNSVLIEECLKTKERSELKQFLVKKGDILVALSGATVGKVGFYANENMAYINQRVAIFRGQSNNFLKFCFLMRGFINFIFLLCNGSAQPNISTKDIGDFKIPLPPLKEQKAIADFLDTKTRQIEEFITKKQKLITLLEEKKQTLINQCVTQGLDPSTPLKDSGVEWLGKIPTHWEVRKLKYVVSLRNQKEGASDFRIGLENIESKTGRFIQADESAFDDEGIGFFEGDVLFGKLRPYLAKVFLADKNGICVSEFLVLKSEGILNRFLKFLMLSGVFIEVVNSSTYGTKMPRANWEFIGNLKIPIPSLEEQKAIAEYLDTQIEKIDLAICKIKSQINLIKEYKTTLICEAVCGRTIIN